MSALPIFQPESRKYTSLIGVVVGFTTSVAARRLDNQEDVPENRHDDGLDEQSPHQSDKCAVQIRMLQLMYRGRYPLMMEYFRNQPGGVEKKTADLSAR